MIEEDLIVIDVEAVIVEIIIVIPREIMLIHGQLI